MKEVAEIKIKLLSMSKERVEMYLRPKVSQALQGRECGGPKLPQEGRGRKAGKLVALLTNEPHVKSLLAFTRENDMLLDAISMTTM